MKKFNLKDLSAVELSKVLQRPMFELDELEGRVKPVLNEVKYYGDKALIDFTKNFDGVELSSFTISEDEYAEAENSVSDELKEAIRVARVNIESFTFLN